MSGGGLPDAEARTLAAVLDTIVPPREDGRLPGAGALGLGQALAPVVAATPGLREGLAAADARARELGAAGFAELPAAERQATLESVGAEQAGFLQALVFHTLAGYYQDARVLEALGLEARPPFPDGYALEPFDESLLDPVRRRGPLYRETP